MNLRRLILILAATLMAFAVDISWSQPQAFEGGRVVNTMDESDAYDYAAGADDEMAEDTSLPWIPILSPTMICLDCWMTKTVNIWDFYHQQAAQRYFAHSQSCADLVLCPDPCIGSGLKYSLLAPIYAMRPHLLMQNCTACGISNPYGVPNPMPGVAVQTSNGPKMVTTAKVPSSELPSLMPSSQPSVSYKPQTAMSESDPWEYAEEGSSVPASQLVAQADLEAKPKAAPAAASEKTAETVTEDSVSVPKKAFSVTDDEYENLKSIEKDLLEGAQR